MEHTVKAFDEDITRLTEIRIKRISAYNRFQADEAMKNYVSGVILYDETIRQKANDGTAFPQYLAKKGIIPGIKVDKGVVEIPLAPGEKRRPVVSGDIAQMFQRHEETEDA